jgi:hypothetical protein
MNPSDRTAVDNVIDRVLMQLRSGRPSVSSQKICGVICK